MNYYRIFLPTKQFIVQAPSKAAATIRAIEIGLIDKFDCQDIQDIVEVSENDYLIWAGKRKAE